MKLEQGWRRITGIGCRVPLLALAVFCFVGLAGQARAALVQNGSFELTATGAGATTGSDPYHICNTTSANSCVSNITNWTATCGSVSSNPCSGTNSPSSFMNTASGSQWNSNIGLKITPGLSPDGGTYIGLDGSSPWRSTISQIINGLTIGQTYILSFYENTAQQKGATGATSDKLEVTFGSTVWDAPTITNTTGTPTGWISVSHTFVATAVSETLSFLNIGTPASGGPPVVLLDGVSLVQGPDNLESVPEPGTVSLFGAGLLCLAAARRRKQKSGPAR